MWSCEKRISGIGRSFRLSTMSCSENTPERIQNVQGLRTGVLNGGSFLNYKYQYGGAMSMCFSNGTSA